MTRPVFLVAFAVLVVSRISSGRRQKHRHDREDSEFSHLHSVKYSAPGRKVKLPCKTKNNFNVTWYRGLIRIDEETGDLGRFRFLSSGLVINPVQHDDGGNYSCLAENRHRQTWSDYTLVVRNRTVNDSNRKKESAPKWSGDKPMPTYVVKPSGENLRMNCPAKGNPTPKFTWEKNGEKISKNPTFVIKSLNLSHKGYYTCTARNRLGQIAWNYSVDVFVPTRQPIVSITTNQTVRTGGTAVFTCVVASAVSPHTEWIRQPRPLADVCRTFMFKQTLDSRRDTILVTLMIVNVTEADAGVYTCMSHNYAGQDNSSTWLTVSSASFRKERENAVSCSTAQRLPNGASYTDQPKPDFAFLTLSLVLFRHL